MLDLESQPNRERPAVAASSTLPKSRDGHFMDPIEGPTSVEAHDKELENLRVKQATEDRTHLRRNSTTEGRLRILYQMSECLRRIESLQLIDYFVSRDDFELVKSEGGYFTTQSQQLTEAEYSAKLKNPGVRRIMKYCKKNRATVTVSGYFNIVHHLGMHLTTEEAVRLVDHFGSNTKFRDTDIEKLFRSLGSKPSASAFRKVVEFVCTHRSCSHQGVLDIRAIPVDLFCSSFEGLAPPDEESEYESEYESEEESEEDSEESSEESSEEDGGSDDDVGKDTGGGHTQLRRHKVPATVQLQFGELCRAVTTFGVFKPTDGVSSSTDRASKPANRLASPRKLYAGWDLSGFFCLVDPAGLSSYDGDLFSFARIRADGQVEVLEKQRPVITRYYLVREAVPSDIAS